MKRSPFYFLNLQAGATMTDAAWCIPSIYTNAMDEYDAVRNGVSIGDWSSMGKIFIQGTQAKEFTQKMIVNDVSRLKPGLALYSSMVNEQGGMCDDIVLYQIAENHYLFITSGGGRYRDLERFEKYSKDMEHVVITDVTPMYGVLSVQGPKSRDFLNTLCTPLISDVPYFGFMNCEIANSKVIVSRTGFVGELGYELIIPADDCFDVWNALLEGGKKFDLKLAGLTICSDVLRLEKGYIAQEYNETINPYEAGVGWTVRLDTDFIGRDALKKIKEDGPTKKLMGFIIDSGDELGVPDADIVYEGKKVGYITSTCFSPYVNRSIGMAYIESKYADIDRIVSVSTSAGMKTAKLCPKVFYDPENARTKAPFVSK